MCEPTSMVIGGAVLSTGLGIAQNAMGHQAQQEAYEANKKSAKEAAAVQIQQIQLQQQQMAQQSARSVFMADLEARRAHAITSVSAGEAGVEGASVDMILDDIERQRLQFKTDEQTNLANHAKQAALEKKGVKSQMNSRINSMAPPSGLATGLGMFGSVLGGASTVASKWPEIK